MPWSAYLPISCLAYEHIAGWKLYWISCVLKSTWQLFPIKWWAVVEWELLIAIKIYLCIHFTFCYRVRRLSEWQVPLYVSGSCNLWHELQLSLSVFYLITGIYYKYHLSKVNIYGWIDRVTHTALCEGKYLENFS